MCGIVGHLGPTNSLPVVIEGLTRLEYRGYDSAGVSLVNEDSRLESYKKAGKIVNLKGVVEEKDITARACIGHTRWATHGEVSDINSHPHYEEDISIVHNGIIENADVLKEQLIADGASFKSETDSEVFLHLLLKEKKNSSSIKEAIFKTFKQLKGNSAFVILNAKTSEIFAIKQGAPLVCGTHPVSSEALVSSDPYALAGHAERIYFPEDNVLCELSSKNENLINFYDEELKKTNRYISEVQDYKNTVSEKGEYDHYMLKEIHEQPELIRSLNNYYFEGEGHNLIEKIEGLKPKRIILIACGTAYYAGLVIRDYIEEQVRIPCVAEIGSEFRYKNPILQEGDVAVFISQSGETADTLAAQKICKDNKIPTVAILNVKGSTLDRECDYTLNIRAGVEICVASTKAYTQMVLMGMIFAEVVKSGSSGKEIKDKLDPLFQNLAHRMDELLKEEDRLKEISENIYDKKGYFYTGRGPYFATALEGALKLKEIAYVHAEGYASGELKHGPIALIDEEMVNIAIVDPALYEKSLANLREVKARKGIIVGVGPKGDTQIEKYSDYYIGLNFEGLAGVAPLYVNIVNQILAYYMARFKGTDIDQPRNLAKSVTVE
jgi:glucosamine--fructose-6-phosphate aminotransferase (isomerizing)